MAKHDKKLVRRLKAENERLRGALAEIDRVLPGFAPGAAVLMNESTLGGLASAIIQCKFHARNALREDAE